MKSENPNVLDLMFPGTVSKPVTEMVDWKGARLKLLGISRELVLDPEWRLCCVACKCHLPSKESNVLAHLGGKKHLKNASKLSTPELIARKKKVAYGKEQEVASTFSDTTEPKNLWFISRQKSAVDEVCASDSSSIELYDVSSTSTVSRELALPFDKSKFLDSVLNGRSCTSTTVADEVDSRNCVARAELNAASRIDGLSTLEVQAFSGTTFFISMPQEVPQPHLARNIRKLIDSTTRKKKAVVCQNLYDELNNPEGYLSLTINQDDSEICFSPDKFESVEEKMPPWVIGSDTVEAITHSECETLILHYEILEFSRFMSPTKMENAARKRVLSTIQNIAEALWPASKVHVFGSYATGLYLPSSDIDLCVMNTPGGGTLCELKDFARAVRNLKGFARKVHCVEAKVGIVKLVSREGNILCDVSIGQMSVMSNVPLIRSYLQDYPALRPLVLVIKCFLEQRGLNDACTGGLGSYSVLILVISHLQMLSHNYSGIQLNLGAVLIEFFDLYGRMFNVCCTGIAVKENGSYYEKVERYDTQQDETLRFSMEDPNDLDNEIGRNSRFSILLREMFNNACELLSSWSRANPLHSVSPLSRIIAPEMQFKQRRVLVINDLRSQNAVRLVDYITRNVSKSNPNCTQN